MAKSRQIKTGFLSGEISPRAYSRIDTEMYGNACRLIENFVVTPQGGALFRQGTKFLGQMSHSSVTADPRAIPVRRGGIDDDIIMSLEIDVFDDHTMLWGPDGRDGNYGDYPQHPYVDTELPLLYYTQRHRLLVMTSGFKPPHFFRFNEFWDLETIEAMPARLFPHRDFDDDRSPQVETVNYTWDFDFLLNTGDTRYTLLRGINSGLIASGFVYFGSGDPTQQGNTIDEMVRAIKIIMEIPENDLSSVSVSWSSAEVYILTLAKPYHERTISFMSSTNGSSWDYDGRKIIFKEASFNSSSEPAWSYPTVVEYGGDYYSARLPSIGETPVVSVSPYWQFTTGGGVKPSWFDWQYPDGNPWNVDAAYGVGDRGFPDVCSFHDQRLVLGASREAPTTLWGSRINKFEDFAINTNFDFTIGVDDDDPWSFDLDSPSSPSIRWITSQRGLIVGTTDGDWVINAEGTITSTNIQAARSTGRKSLSERPLVFGNEVFYIDQSSTKLRHVYYERASEGLRNEDATLMAEHLGRKGLFRLAQMQVPESVVFAVTQDHEIIAMAYDRFAGVSAWCRLTFGDVQNIGDIVSGFGRERGQDLSRGTDILYMTTKHDGTWYMEFMPYPELTDNEEITYSDTIHLDSWYEDDFAGTNSGTVPDGFYVSKTVSVMAQLQSPAGPDDPNVGYVYLGEKVVSAGGVITLDAPAWGVQVGFKFQGDIETVDVSAGPQGVAMGTKRRWDELWIQLYKSMPPLYKQTDGSEWQRAAVKYDAIPMDNPPELFSGEIKMHASGYGSGRVFIRQDLPFPCHVTGLFGRVSSNET